MKLYIVRHGQAELLSASENTEIQDSRRALTAEGKREAQAAGRHLKQALGEETPKVLVSPYRRAQETAQEIISIVGCSPAACITVDSVTPKNSPAEALTALKAYNNEESIVLISHQPLVSQLISQLVWQKDKPGIAMGTAYVACLEAEVFSAEMAELLWVKSPRAFS